MVFENGVKNTQAAAYNGARTVYSISNSTYAEENIYILVHRLHTYSFE
jgi:hypothetical protein